MISVVQQILYKQKNKTLYLIPMNGVVFERKDKTSTFCPKKKPSNQQIKKKIFSISLASIMIVVGLWLMSITF